MRPFAFLFLGTLALGGVAQAQTGTAAGPTKDAGYVEVVAQSAFGNVTSQSYSVEVGVTIRPNLQVFVEGGQTRNVAPAQLGIDAQTIAGALSQTQANVGFSTKEPAVFAAGGVKYIMPVAGSKARPYVLGGFGMAKVKRDVAFTVGGSDVTSTLSQYGIVLGTDLSGDFTKPMFVAGGGVTWPVWQRLVVDLQFRFGKIFAEEGGINVARAGIGIGVLF
jgi:opacity protein-like surface antigen